MSISILKFFSICLIFITSTCFSSANLDFDGDSKADILWRNQNTNVNWLWRMSGQSISQSTSINTIPNYWDIVGRGDFNGDGLSDVLWRNNVSGRNWVYLMDGQHITTSAEINYVTDLDWEVKGVNDFNGDGKDDIIWRNKLSGRTWIYLMDGKTITKSIGSQSVNDLNWIIVATGDMNGDSKADVVWRHKLSGQNYIWLMDGSNIFDQYVLNKVGTSWQIVGSGDLNADGTDDLLWRNSEDGRNWAYLMRNGAISGSEQVNKVSDLSWQIRTIGDFNGDGKVDLFWRHQETGQTYIYLMNGVQVAQSSWSNTVKLDWLVISESSYESNSKDKTDIVGTWVSQLDPKINFTFTDTGHFAGIDTNSVYDVGCEIALTPEMETGRPGFEYGTYELAGSEFSFEIIEDTNGCWGLSDNKVYDNSYIKKIEVVGDLMRVYGVEEGSHYLHFYSRVIDASNELIGGYYEGDFSNEFYLIIFSSASQFVELAYTSDENGLTVVNYQWNELTGITDILSVELNTSGVDWDQAIFYPKGDVLLWKDREEFGPMKRTHKSTNQPYISTQEILGNFEGLDSDGSEYEMTVLSNGQVEIIDSEGITLANWLIIYGQFVIDFGDAWVVFTPTFISNSVMNFDMALFEKVDVAGGSEEGLYHYYGTTLTKK